MPVCPPQKLSSHQWADHLDSARVVAGSSTCEPATAVASQAVRQMSGCSDLGSAQSSDTFGVHFQPLGQGLRDPYSTGDIDFGCSQWPAVNQQEEQNMVMEHGAAAAAAAAASHVMAYRDASKAAIGDNCSGLLALGSIGRPGDSSINPNQAHAPYSTQLPFDFAPLPADINNEERLASWSNVYRHQSEGMEGSDGPQQAFHPHGLCHADSAASLRHHHQLLMLDLMLARLAAADGSFCQGSSAISQINPYMPDIFRLVKPTYSQQSMSITSDDASTAFMAPPMPQQSTTKHQTQEVETLDSALHGINLIEQGEVIVERAFESAMDCPGSCLVPDEWLIDDCSESALDSYVPEAMRLPLSLMPPSLGRLV